VRSQRYRVRIARKYSHIPRIRSFPTTEIQWSVSWNTSEALQAPWEQKPLTLKRKKLSVCILVFKQCGEPSSGYGRSGGTFLRKLTDHDLEFVVTDKGNATAPIPAAVSTKSRSRPAIGTLSFSMYGARRFYHLSGTSPALCRDASTIGSTKFAEVPLLTLPRHVSEVAYGGPARN
jgi:hypothetical protein